MPKIAVIDNADNHAAHTDGTLHAQGDMIRIVADPDRHFFPAFEDGAFDQQGFEFDRAELGIFCPDGLFTQVTDIQMIDLPVQEHIEVYFIPWFEFTPFNIAGVEDGAQDVLYTGRHRIDPFRGDGRIGGFHEGDVLVGLVSPFIDIPDELHRLKSGRIDITFVAVPHSIKFVIEAVGLAIPDYMI